MRVILSKAKKGVIAVAGHVGCGHCHSHSGHVQDDSGGLALVLALFQEATGASFLIKDIRVKTGMDGFFEVHIEGGGKSRTTARRGITQQEARLAESLIGCEAVRTQSLVMDAFGRLYSQGVHEAPVALQTALANGALDAIAKQFPENFVLGYESLPGSCGLMTGAVLDVNGIPVSVLGTVNASIGGIGPNEDMEGNAFVGKKAELMAMLGMENMPTIVVEGKSYSPLYSKEVSECTFLVRADRIADNPVVAHCIYQAALELGFPAYLREDVMARVPGLLANKTRELGEKIAALGIKLQDAQYAQEKIDILAELALLVSEDGAGISFMSNKLHEIIGSTGLMPGTGAVVNYLVPPLCREELLIPFMTEEDVNKYVALIKAAVCKLEQKLPEAMEQVRCYPGNLEDLVWSKSK